MQVTALASAGTTKTASAAKPSSFTAPDFGTVLAAVAAPGSGPVSGSRQAIAKKALAKPDSGSGPDVNPKPGAGRTRAGGDSRATRRAAADAATATANPPVSIPLPVTATPEAAAQGQFALTGTAATAFATQSLPAAAGTANAQASTKNRAEPPDSDSASSGSATVSETSPVPAQPSPNPLGAAGFCDAADSCAATASQFVSSEMQSPFSEIPGLITQTAAAQPIQPSISPSPATAAVGKDPVANAARQVPAAPQTVPDDVTPQALSSLNPTLTKATPLTPSALVATFPASSGQTPAQKSPVTDAGVSQLSQPMKFKQPPDPKLDSSPGLDQTLAEIRTVTDSTATGAIPSETRETAPSGAVSVPETEPGGGMSAPSSIPSPLASAASGQATSAPKTAAATGTPVAAAPEPAASTEKKSATPVQADTIVPQVQAPAASGKDSAGAVAAPVTAGPAPAAQSKAEQPLELPKTHQMLDSAPPAAPAPPPARIASEADGELQMHVGIRTTAFGTVEIHTVVQQSQVGIAIHGERELARWFSSEVPGIESGLKDHRLNLTAVDFDSGRSGVQTATSFHQGQPRRDFSETTSSCATSIEDQDTAGELATVEVLPSELEIRPTGTRVSIHV